MAGVPRQGTFTRDLRLNPARAPASEEEAEVLRSPTDQSVGPVNSSFAEQLSLANTRQRREPAHLAGPRLPAAAFGSSGVVRPTNTSPTHAFSRIASPAYGADRDGSKALLSPTGRRRFRSNSSISNLRITLVVLVGGFLVLVFMLYRGLMSPTLPESQPASACEAQYDTLEPHAHPLHHTMHEGEHGDFPVHSARASIAIVTMADTRKVPLPKNLAYLSDIKPGSLVNILEVVWRNRQEYADRHGYTLVNGTDLVGNDRPPSWYKIKVVESVLDQYDWVFYLDADAWITNPEIPLEAVLPAPGGADLVVTEDAAGANAGSWVLRSSDWSREFLARWWSMDSFIRPPGDTKSGDNDSLKHILGTMSSTERARRVAIPPQCALNSYLWRPSVRQWTRLFTSSGKVRSGIWRPGHLLVHLAGWDNYKGLMQLQKLLVNSHDLTRRSSTGLPQPRRSRKYLLPNEPLAELPSLSTTSSTPDSGSTVGSTSQAMRTISSAAEFTSSDLPQQIAVDVINDARAGTTGTGALGAGRGAVSSTRALLPDADQTSDGENAKAQLKPEESKQNASLRAGCLFSADRGGNNSVSSTCCRGDTRKGSSGCQGYPADMSDTASESTGFEGSKDQSDYAIVTGEELRELNIDISDPYEEDQKILDIVLSDDEEGTEEYQGSSGEWGADAGAISDLDLAQTRPSEEDKKRDEALVMEMEITDQVVTLLKQRRSASQDKGLERRGLEEEVADLLQESEDMEEDQLVGDESGWDDTSVASDDLAESGDSVGDSVGKEEYRGGATVKDLTGTRELQLDRQEFLQQSEYHMSDKGASDTGRQRGRALLQIEESDVSEGGIQDEIVVDSTVIAQRTEGLPEQAAVDLQAIQMIDSLPSRSLLKEQPARNAAVKDKNKSVQGSKSTKGITDSVVKPTEERTNNGYSAASSGLQTTWLHAGSSRLQSSVPDETVAAEESGGRPYEALEELPGDDQDYEAHSEEVHLGVNIAQVEIVNGPATPKRIPRRTLVDMSTEEIDALEEHTQLSAEAAKRMFVVDNSSRG